MDIDGFIRDGYVVIRGAVDPDTTAACRELIWAGLAERGIRRDEPASWPVTAQFDDLGAEPFSAAGLSPALTAAYDELVGPGRWTPRVDVGRAIVVRFPGEDRGNAGYHIEGSYAGPGGHHVNVRSRARGLLALFLFTDVGPDDAPTRLVCGSHLFVPEFLAPYGEPGTLSDAEFWRPSVLCRPVAHAMGRRRRVLVPPVHRAHRDLAASRRRPRTIAQPAVQVAGGFSLDGSDPPPVAKAIVAGLAAAARINE